MTESQQQAKTGAMGCWGIIAIVMVVLLVCGLLYLMVV